MCLDSCKHGNRASLRSMGEEMSVLTWNGDAPMNPNSCKNIIFSTISILAILLYFQTPARENSSASESPNNDLPVLLAPSDGAQINYQPSFDWSGSTWVPFGFNLVVEDDPTFASPELDVHPFSSYYSAGTLIDGLYY